MRKFLAIILAFLYLTASGGITVRLHYCMDELVNWDLSDKGENKCPNCGMEKKDHGGCCKDENKFLKNDADQKAAETGFQAIQLITLVLPVSFVEITSVNFPDAAEENTFTHAPPRSSSVAAYIINRTILV